MWPSERRWLIGTEANEVFFLQFGCGLMVDSDNEFLAILNFEPRL